MSTMGRMPALARPAAKATACDSQMPTSKKRSGKSVADLFQLVALAHGRRDDGDARVVLHRVVDGAC